MIARRARLLIYGTVLCAACGPRNLETGETPATSSELVSYAGQVSVAGVGGSTVTTLSVDGGRAIGVVGALEPEVRALSGARVRVQGPPGTGFPGDAVDVRSYEVLEVNGQRPYVGVLASTAQGLVLEQSETERLPISGGPPGFASQVGAKVWLTGPLTAGRLQVQSYGVIRAR
jgi:hypothetical protein